jgi:tyrosine-protein kinase Etk/Wzc
MDGMSERPPELAAPRGQEEDISLLDLLGTLLRHKRLIIGLTAATAFGVIAFSLGSLLLPADKSYLPNLYTPKALMLVNDDAGSGGISSMLASSGLGNLAGLAGVSAGKSYGQLAVLIARSNPVLDELIDKYGLVERYKVKKSPRAETRKALLEKYSVAYDEKTGTLSIGFEDRDPELARDLVNRAVELLDLRFTTIGGNRNQAKKEQLEGKLVDVQAEMRRLEVDIQAFQQKHGVITIESLATEQITVVAKVRSELIMKEMEIKTYGDISRVEDPALRRLQAERDNLSKLLGELEKGFSEYEKVLPSQRDLPKLAIEFSHLQRDLIIQEKIFELLTQQNELTKLSLAGEDPVIQILELAEAPDKKSGPSRGMICVVAIMAAFFLSLLAAFAIEAVANIRRDPEAMAKLKGAVK